MLEAMFYFAGMCAVVWLAIALVDLLVAIARREWRFSIRSMLAFTAAISLVAGMLASVIRN